MRSSKAIWLGASMVIAACIGLLAFFMLPSRKLSPEQIWEEVARIEGLPDGAVRVGEMRALVSRVDEQAGFYLSDRMCLYLLEAGEVAEAEECARELLRQTESQTSDWNFGNAVHRANIVLGRAALTRDDLDAAERFLAEAARTPGSPQLNSYGPDITLARLLLARGRREAVARYANECRRFWKDGKDEILPAWARFASEAADSTTFFEYSPSEEDVVVTQGLEGFWGGMKLRSGETIQPVDEEERRLSPVGRSYAGKVVSVGVPFGLALRCGVPWKEQYLSFMKAEAERQNFSEKQRTFVGFLHGYSQQRTAKKAALLDCSEPVVDEISAWMTAYEGGLRE